MFGDGEVDDATPLMREDDQHEQYAARQRGAPRRSP
jgi:hypothetical protein